jgi:hypothetical protein
MLKACLNLLFSRSLSPFSFPTNSGPSTTMLLPLRATFALMAALSATLVQGQNPNFTYVDCTDQTQIRRTGSWSDQGLPTGTNFSLDPSKIYNGTWEL